MLESTEVVCQLFWGVVKNFAHERALTVKHPPLGTPVSAPEELLYSGAVRYLTDSEEEEAAEFIVGCALIGYPKTVRDRIVTYGW